MCGCIPLPSWAGGNARDDAPPTRRQERVERYAEELRRERGLSFVADEEERRLEERLAELEAKHAEALRAGDAGRLADLEGAIADLERKLEVDAAAYTPEPRKSFIPSLGSIAVWKSTSASGASRRKILISTQVHRRDRFLRNAAAPAPAALGRDARRGERPRRRAAEPPVPGLGRRVTRAAPHRISKEATTEAP